MPNVLNTTATVSGKTLAIVENAGTVTGLWAFDRDPSPPFAVSAGSAMVANLDADKLDGQEGAYYLNAGLGSKWTVVLDTTSTGAKNDWAPGLAGHTYINWSGAGTLAVTGIAGGVTGQIVTFSNRGTGLATFANASASSLVGNRFSNTVTSGLTPIAANGHATWIYNGTVWVLVHHTQGARITPTYDGLHYAGSGTMTWTVSALDRIEQSYELRGAAVDVSFLLASTTVGGVASTALHILSGAWGGFTVSSIVTSTNPLSRALDNNVLVDAFAEADPTLAYIRILKPAFGNWALSANLTDVQGSIIVSVT